MLGSGHELLQLFVDYFDELELVQPDEAHSFDYLDVVDQLSDVEDLLLFCHTLVKLGQLTCDFSPLFLYLNRCIHAGLLEAKTSAISLLTSSNSL